VKFTEKEIQDYIWDSREDFQALLTDPGKPEYIEFKDGLSDVSAQALIKNRILKKIHASYTKLYYIELIGNEVPLEQDLNTTIRADFLATFPGDTGIGIIELKKSSQTERQAFTELLAYSNHLTTTFPAMSREDVVYILISPMTTRIARDAVIQSLTFDNRVIIALVPSFEDPNDIKSLKLGLWTPTDTEIATFSSVAFREANFSVCKVVWEYSEGHWDASKGESPTSDLIEKLNSVSSLAAQHMEEAGIHGFTYCSQVWSELEHAIPYTKSLILVGLNPYAVGGTQFLMKNQAIKEKDLPYPQEYLPSISEIIPGLLKSAKALHRETHYLQDLHSVWSSQLFNIGKKVVDSSIRTTSGFTLNTDQGFMDWHTYQMQILEDVVCQNFLIRATGLVRQLYLDIMNLDYSACSKVGIKSHPVHGDLPYSAIEFITSQRYFREFILRILVAESEDKNEKDHPR